MRWDRSQQQAQGQQVQTERHSQLPASILSCNTLAYVSRTTAVPFVCPQLLLQHHSRNESQPKDRRSSQLTEGCVPSWDVNNPMPTKKQHTGSASYVRNLEFCVTIYGLTVPPMFVTAADSGNVPRDWGVPEALRRARVSRARPSSTKASSMTGSSKKPISKPAPGSSRLAVPAVNDVAAPRPIKLFMLGLPLKTATYCVAPGMHCAWMNVMLSNGKPIHGRQYRVLDQLGSDPVPCRMLH